MNLPAGIKANSIFTPAPRSITSSLGVCANPMKGVTKDRVIQKKERVRMLHQYWRVSINSLKFRLKQFDEVGK